MAGEAHVALDLEDLDAEVFDLGLEPEPERPVELHLEVALRPECGAGREAAAAGRAGAAAAALQWAGAQAALEAGALVRGAALGALRRWAGSVAVCDAGRAPGAAVAPQRARLHVHVHALHEHAGGPRRATLGGAGAVWALPAAELQGAWEALVLEGALKGDCLRLALAAVAAGPAAAGGPCGRALLLHGPPGCGKTSLCRALAHKLAVRLAPQYPRARLIEVDAHSLFSRWFSESGKLVARLFQEIFELTDDPQTLTIVLVDEVESLAMARAAGAAGLEPSDAARAVAALLAGLDRLRRRANALLLATSNAPRAVDGALLDRAVLRRLVPAPGPAAAYELLRAGAAALVARGAVRARGPLWGWQVLRHARPEQAGRACLALRAVAEAAAARRVSARALARLPLLALALHLPPRPPHGPPPLPRLVLALRQALRQHLRDEADLEAASRSHAA